MPKGKKIRVIRHQLGRRNRIPGGITPEHFLQITGILRKILQDIDNELRKLRTDERPKELHIRLNESDKPFPLPVFAGWEEAGDVRQTRQDWNHPHPGLHRFGDDIYSEVYGEAFRYANEKGEAQFQFRDWEEGEILEKRSGEKATDPKAANCFQTCLAIVVKVRGQLRAVGTLVVGFRHRPQKKSLTAAHNTMRQWAREPDTANGRDSLITFLKKFDLGGPRLKDSNWWKLI